MNLWLDDVRPAPEGWTWAKSADEAIRYLRTGEVEQASLDYDLGMVDVRRPSGFSIAREVSAPTGLFLVKWMAEGGGVWPKQKPTVHSANPEGAAEMRRVIDRYGPYGAKP